MRNREALIVLVRLGLGYEVEPLPKVIDWTIVQALAMNQGLAGIAVDGLDRIPLNQRPAKKTLLQIVGTVLQDEERQATQWKSACKMAQLFADNDIRTYVLKGFVFSECYPNPKHRNSSDLDCFLVSSNSNCEAWELGNRLVEESGYKVSRGFYKNSSFHLPGLSVENHQFMVPFRGNKTLMNLEKRLQSYLRTDNGEDKIENTELYRPPVMMSALFLIEHAYSHFLHEGLTWRNVLDWMMFSSRHKQEIDWPSFESQIDVFGFRRFYDAFYHLGQYFVGDIVETSLTTPEKKMLADIWAPLDLHETRHGLKGKLALTGNTLRARWKYRYFSEISMLHALWIQVTGVLFVKQPRLY